MFKADVIGQCRWRWTGTLFVTEGGAGAGPSTFVPFATRAGLLKRRPHRGGWREGYDM